MRVKNIVIKVNGWHQLSIGQDGRDCLGRKIDWSKVEEVTVQSVMSVPEFLEWQENFKKTVDKGENRCEHGVWSADHCYECQK